MLLPKSSKPFLWDRVRISCILDSIRVCLNSTHWYYQTLSLFHRFLWHNCRQFRRGKVGICWAWSSKRDFFNRNLFKHTGSYKNWRCIFEDKFGWFSNIFYTIDSIFNRTHSLECTIDRLLTIHNLVDRPRINALFHWTKVYRKDIACIWNWQNPNRELKVDTSMLFHVFRTVLFGYCKFHFRHMWCSQLLENMSSWIDWNFIFQCMFDIFFLLDHK